MDKKIKPLVVKLELDNHPKTEMYPVINLYFSKNPSKKEVDEFVKSKTKC